MNTDCIVPLDGLKVGHSCFKWHLDRKFFDDFDNSDIVSADLDVRCEIEKTGTYFGADCYIDGVVTVLCDRCLADLELPVETGVLMSVKFADVDIPAFEDTDSDRELYFIPRDSAELDLKQTVYDFVCTSLPLQRVHEDGKCDAAVEKYLSHEIELEGAPDTDNPFASLKSLLEEK